MQNGECFCVYLEPTSYGARKNKGTVSLSKMTHQPNVWEAKVGFHNRITFHIEGKYLFMQRVGTHEIYRNP